MDASRLEADRAVFRRLLREVREEAGLDQRGLAKLLHKPQSYVNKNENETVRRKVDPLELRYICHACGTTLPEFIRRLEEALAGRN